jgi:aminoglycoside phosphotransferase (APT) family kinase protein
MSASVQNPAAFADGIVAPETRDLGELSRRLADWLAARIPAARGLVVSEADYPRGAGQSHETILFEASWHEGTTAQSLSGVVRIKPRGFTVFPDDLFEPQFQIMRLMHERGTVRVAEPLWLEQDPGILGAPFFVMRKVAGRVPVSIPSYVTTGWVAEATPDQRRRMWDSGLRQLAAIHCVPTAAAPFLAGPPHAREGLAQELDKYRRFIAWLQEDWGFPHLGPVLEAGLARLENAPPANHPPGIVWGDARMGNMMFAPDFTVAAVMDWEQPSLGGALQDLGWWLVLSETMHGATDTRPHLAGMGTRAETIALWEAETGLSAADIEWYEDFTRLKMSCTGVRLAALRGTEPADEEWYAKRLKVR